MRHGRKSRSVLFDGYKRHVLRDLDTGLVPAVGITAANAPEATVTDDIAADLEAAGRHLSELHIDRAYLASALVRGRTRTWPSTAKPGRSATSAAGSPRTSSPSISPPGS